MNRRFHVMPEKMGLGWQVVDKTNLLAIPFRTRAEARAYAVKMNKDDITEELMALQRFNMENAAQTES